MNLHKFTASSGFKGVYKRGSRWEASISPNRKYLYLGIFDTSDEAALAYNAAALIHYGVFARLNDV